jgi:gas vesicle structural protein
MPSDRRAQDDLDAYEDGDQLVLSDVLNHVFDKGVVITGEVIISIGGIDLVRLGLDLVISSVESETRRARRVGERPESGDLPVLPSSRGE